MRILGPDGNPVPSGPPPSEEVQQILAKAQEIAQAGDPATALHQLIFAFQTDVTSDAVLDAACDLLQQMSALTGGMSEEEFRLFDRIRRNRDDAEGYFQIGSRFFHMGQAFIARPFLARARNLLGDQRNELSNHADVEHAQSLLDLGAYEETIAAIHEINEKYGGLPIWLVLQMAECYALMRQIDEAEAVYEIASPEAAAQFEGMDTVREEVGDMLARVRDFDEKPEMDLRDWHYVQTRGILLEMNPDAMPGEEEASGRWIMFQPSEEDVAYIIGLAAALLDAKGHAPTKLLWLGEGSETLARLFGQWWEIEPENMRPYRIGDNTDDEEDLALLVMAHSGDIPDEETYIDLIPARAGLLLFALDTRWTERQPLCPDIAGFLTQMCNLPWETRLEVNEAEQTMTKVEETRAPQEIAEIIARQFPQEEECDEWAQEMIEAYDLCTDLIFDHRDGSLPRRPLPPHSPILSPKFGL